MRQWKFTYQREYGRGRKYSKYVNDYSFAALDLYDAYRIFGEWIRAQPYGRHSIQLLKWVEMSEPLTEQSEPKEEKMKIKAKQGAFVLPAEG